MISYVEAGKQGRRNLPARPRLWARTRVQLGVALLLASVLPAALWIYFIPFEVDTLVVQITTVGTFAAIMLTHYLLKNMSAFPGVNASSFIFPSTLLGFGLAVLIYFFLRLEYSRSLFLVSACATLAWFYAAHALTSRVGRLNIGIVPFGNVGGISAINRVSWTELRSPLSVSGSYDALVADFRAHLPDEWEVFLADCALNGLPVFHVKQLRESLTGRVEIEHLSENSFGSLVPFAAYLKAKRVIDFAAALLMGLLTAPFLMLIAVAVKLDSPGPALFRQRRIGYRGRPFMVTKFRTMTQVIHCAGERENAITGENDMRITRFGRWLRRTRIDEFPQIWNILCGEMSWIGPRPEAEVLSKWYEAELPFYRYRHIVPPGITGWAQVNQGHVADLENVKFKLHYDFYYIKNFSAWLDALIVFKTIKTMWTGFGAR